MSKLGSRDLISRTVFATSVSSNTVSVMSCPAGKNLSISKHAQTLTYSRAQYELITESKSKFKAGVALGLAMQVASVIRQDFHMSAGSRRKA